MRVQKAIFIALSAVFSVSVAFAKNLNVGPKGPYFTIQSAVNAASPGDQINVQAGTYHEQVTVPTNGIKLQSGGAVISPPPSMTSGFLMTIGGQNVTVSGFTFQGPLPDVAFSGAASSGGIYVMDGSATITNNYLTQMWQATAADRGIQNGVGILVGRQFDGTTGQAVIANNTLDHWQKTGIVVDNTGSNASIQNNQLTGEGPISYTAQNGIQVGRGATGVVKNNQVSSMSYTPATYAASGILIFQTDDVDVSNNHVNACDLGVAFADVMSSEIDHNQIQNGLYGIDVDEFSTGSQNNEIDHNQSTNNSQEGIFVSVDSINNLFDHNQFNHNAFLDAEDDSVGTGTAGTGNSWTQNQIGTDNKGGGLGKH